MTMIDDNEIPFPCVRGPSRLQEGNRFPSEIERSAVGSISCKSLAAVDAVDVIIHRGERCTGSLLRSIAKIANGSTFPKRYLRTLVVAFIRDSGGT